MKNKKIFNIKGLKSFRSSLRNRSTLLRQNYGTLKNQKIVTPVNTINHPGRNQLLRYFDYNCGAATPPSKGGETYLTFVCIIMVLA